MQLRSPTSLSDLESSSVRVPIAFISQTQQIPGILAPQNGAQVLTAKLCSRRLHNIIGQMDLGEHSFQKRQLTYYFHHFMFIQT